MQPFKVRVDGKTGDVTVEKQEEPIERLNRLVFTDDELTKVTRSLDVVSKKLGVKKSWILHKTRVRGVVLARHLAMWLMHRVSGISLNRVADIFNQHHTTVCHACQKMDTFKDRALRDELERLVRG